MLHCRRFVVKDNFQTKLATNALATLFCGFLKIFSRKNRIPSALYKGIWKKSVPALWNLGYFFIERIIKRDGENNKAQSAEMHQTASNFYLPSFLLLLRFTIFSLFPLPNCTVHTLGKRDESVKCAFFADEPANRLMSSSAPLAISPKKLTWLWRVAPFMPKKRIKLIYKKRKKNWQ